MNRLDQKVATIFGSTTKLNSKVISKYFKKWSWILLRTILIIGLSYVLLYPLIYMLSTALRPYEQILDPSVVWIPKSVTMENFRQAARLMGYSNTLINSIKVTLISSILSIISCGLAGYGFAMFKFKGREILFAGVILSLIVPPQVYIISSYLEFRFFDGFGLFNILKAFTGKEYTVNLIGNPLSIYLPAAFGMGLRSGLFIYIFRQFFRGIPKELEEAAYIDGYGAVMTFLKVIVPNAIPAIVTVFLFSVVWYWNDYYTMEVFMNTRPTLSVVLSELRYRILNDLNKMQQVDEYLYITWVQAGCLMTISPLLIIYMFFQRYFIESVERTGIVG